MLASGGSSISTSFLFAQVFFVFFLDILSSFLHLGGNQGPKFSWGFSLGAGVCGMCASTESLLLNSLGRCELKARIIVKLSSWLMFL